MLNVAFLIVSGSRAAVDALSLTAVESFCKSQAWNVAVTRQSSEGRDHASICIQVRDEPDHLLRGKDDHLFLQHGHVYGHTCADNVHELKGRARESFLASWYIGMDTDLREVDGDCVVGQVKDGGREFTVWPDPLGFRRVFYCQNEELIVVSTRLPLILHLCNESWRLDAAVARMFITKRSWAMWPKTLVNGVKTLPSAHGVFCRDNKLTLFNCWRPVDVGERLNDYEAVNERLRKKICLSMQRVAVSRKTAISLSGGTDSTCLVKMARDSGVEFDAVSVGYDVRTEAVRHCYDETGYAAQIAKTLGVTFRSILFSKQDVSNALDELPQLWDQPGYDPTTFYVFCKKLQKENYTTLIGGMGGDACFSPSSKYTVLFRRWKLLEPFAKNPLLKPLMNAVATALNMRGPLSHVRAMTEGRVPESPIEFVDRYQETRRVGISHRLFNGQIVDDVNQIVEGRAKVFNQLIQNASSLHELYFYHALWTDPAEYHMDLSGVLNHVDCCMPFVGNSFTQELLRHSGNPVQATRRFEVELAGGIPQQQLIAKKNGLCLPYEVWGPELMKDEVERAIDSGLIDTLGVDEDALLKICQPFLDQTQGYLQDPYTRHAASLIWRLACLSRYVDCYALC